MRVGQRSVLYVPKDRVGAPPPDELDDSNIHPHADEELGARDTEDMLVEPISRAARTIVPSQWGDATDAEPNGRDDLLAVRGGGPRSEERVADWPGQASTEGARTGYVP